MHIAYGIRNLFQFIFEKQNHPFFHSDLDSDSDSDRPIYKIKNCAKMYHIWSIRYYGTEHIKISKKIEKKRVIIWDCEKKGAKKLIIFVQYEYMNLHVVRC